MIETRSALQQGHREPQEPADHRDPIQLLRCFQKQGHANHDALHLSKSLTALPTQRPSIVLARCFASTVGLVHPYCHEIVSHTAAGSHSHLDTDRSVAGNLVAVPGHRTRLETA